MTDFQEHPKEIKENDYSSPVLSSTQASISAEETNLQPMNQPCGCGGSSKEGESGCSCNSKSNKMMAVSFPSYVYAIGKVVLRFPNRSIELEFSSSHRKTIQRRNKRALS